MCADLGWTGAVGPVPHATVDSDEGQLEPIGAGPLDGTIQGLGEFANIEPAPAGKGPRLDRPFAAEPRARFLVPPGEAMIGLKKSLAMVHGLRLSQRDAILQSGIVPPARSAGSSTLNRGHEHQRAIRRFRAREGRPRGVEGVQRGGGT